MTRPPTVSHNEVVDMTYDCPDEGLRAVALALVTISEQLDRVIQLLEPESPSAALGRALDRAKETGDEAVLHWVKLVRENAEAGE